MDKKRQLLDPVSTVCRLVSLNFKPVNTKIAIYDHVVLLQPPTMSQSVIRYIYGDARDNISALFLAILRFIKWYVIPIRNKSINTQDENTKNYFICLEKLVHNLCAGFKILQDTYKQGNVVISLQYYINILNDSIEGNFDDNRIPLCLEDTEELDDSGNLLDYNKIKRLWNYDKIKDICELYDKCFESTNNDDVNKNTKIESYLLAADNLISSSENGFRDLVKSNNQG